MGMLPLLAGAALVKRQEAMTPGDLGANGQRLCAWREPQSAMLRDRIYFDGGEQQFVELSTLLESNDQPRQKLYYIDLHVPFNASNNFNASTVLQTLEKPGIDVTPRTSFGHLLANDYGMYSVGGALDYTDSFEPPATDWAVAYDAFEHPPAGVANLEKWHSISLGDEMTRSVVQGAYASAPSEGKAWIFGGSTNRRGLDIQLQKPVNNTGDTTHDRLIIADLTVRGEETFRNESLPNHVIARSQAEMVWLPTGGEGALVVIGGTSMTYNQSSGLEKFSQSTVDEWETEGKSYMKDISVYDIENDEWYTQETTGEFPPPTADACAVVATSQNGDSHHIYVYGGYDGLSVGDATMNSAIRGTRGMATIVDIWSSVYVLSLPAFQWTRVHDEPDQPGLRGHRCHRVSENSMLVVGGYQKGNANACVTPNIIRTFDLNTAKFTTEYHPDNNAPYEIPEVVVKEIGGDGKGGGDPAKDLDKGLLALLTTKYSKDPKTYWPFEALEPTSPGNSQSDESDSADESASGGGGLPSYVPPLLGTILGLLVLGCLLALVLYYLRRRRRNIKRLQSDSAASTVVKKRQTWSWLMNTKDGAEKGSLHEYTHTPGTEHTDPFDGSTAYGSPSTERQNPLNEAPESQIYEMPGNSIAQELSARNPRTVTISDDVQELGPGPSNEPISPLSPRPSINRISP